ncbi:YlmH family RNA-binding protein [Longirhabdus pacifica]|uniref:YlmH family RNA-binding protein n=1 Tax=Longirhabdus pacifica TaxID=2305227 RepID=UPI001009137E|nr:YlmH/Sll1252 family protein [Longirhabdus pacifica]
MNNIYVHYHQDEHHFVDRCMEWAQQAEENHKVKHTDFLDPREQQILQSIVSKYQDIHMMDWGGHDDAERKKAIIAPHYVHMDESSFSELIQVVQIHSEDSKYDQLHHGDFLGSFLGLGLKRNKLGDIQLLPHACQVVVDKDIAHYISSQLLKVGSVKVATEVLPIDQLQPMQVRFSSKAFTVSSLRLDNVVSSAINQSRAKAMQLIKQNKCKVNWKWTTQPSLSLESGDVISCKGFGRFKIQSLEGPTKKGKFRLMIGFYD